MIKFLGVAGLSMAMTGSAFAADLTTTKIPTPPAPVATDANWTGCYVGVVGGLASASSKATFVSSGSLSASNSPTSAEFGGTVGCDYQASQFVFGALADFSWSGLNASTANVPVPAYTVGVNSRWSNTDRVRFGYAFSSALIYLTGGLSYRNIEAYEYNTTFPLPKETIGKSRVGWNLGVGADVFVTSKISIKAEYLHEEFGKESYTWKTPQFDPKNVSFNDNLFRLGVAYHF